MPKFHFGRPEDVFKDEFNGHVTTFRIICAEQLLRWDYDDDDDDDGMDSKSLSTSHKMHGVASQSGSVRGFSFNR